MPNTKDQFPTILIADDIESNRALLTEILSAERYRIVHAEDGDEAMELLEGGEVDLALLDVMMPHRSGFAVCRELKSNPDTRLIPVVLVTSLTASEDRMQGIESGAAEVLVPHEISEWKQAADTRDRALELVRKMEGSQHFQQTQIEQEQSQSGITPGDNVQFDISAVYVPDLADTDKRSTP